MTCGIRASGVRGGSEVCDWPQYRAPALYTGNARDSDRLGSSYEFRGGQRPAEPYVQAFAAWVRETVEQGDRARLLRTLDDAPQAQRAHPTPDHLWPLLVAAGASDAGSGPLPAAVIEGGVEYGMLCMDSYAFGWAGEAH